MSLLSQLLTAFLGDSQGQSALLLPNIYSSGGSVNLWINKLGEIKTVDGWTKQNAAAYTTDTGASAAMIRGMYQYRKHTGGAFTRQLVFALDDGVNEWELHRSSDLGVTKTLIADLGAGSIGTIPDFTQFGDELYITNGVIAPRIWNGTALSTAGATQIVAPTLADGGAGALNGNYKYRVVPIQANKARKPGSVASAALDVQNRRINVSWTADADVTVIGYELYRTSGTGLDFYFVSYIDGRTTVAYNGDSLPDYELITRAALSVIAAHGDAPPSGAYFAVAHKGRVWYGRTDTFPRRWWHSDPGDGDSVYQDRNYMETTDAESIGDVSTGGTGEFENMIVLWCEHSVWTVSGTGTIIGTEIDWRKRRTNCSTGTVWHRTVSRVPVGSVYTDERGVEQKTSKPLLAFLTPQKDIRVFDGRNDQIISFPKKDTLARLNVTQQRKSYSYVDEAHGMIVWVFPIDASTEPNYSVAWNYLYGTWHEWDGTSFGHVAEAADGTQRVLLAGEALTATGGFIYKLWNGNNRAGASITATLMTKPIYPPAYPDGPLDLSHEKRFENAFLLFEKDATPTDITVSVLAHDAADSDAVTISRTAFGATSRVKVPLRMKSTDTNPGKYFHGVGFRLKLTSTATSGPWTLKGAEITYEPLRGQSR